MLVPGVVSPTRLAIGLSMSPSPLGPVASLDEQYAAFLDSRMLAMPIAGAIAWTGIGIAGYLLPLGLAVWAVFIGAGMIFYIALGVARLTGEDLLGKQRKGNFFDRLFLCCIGQALLVYAIAIPFFLIESTSLPLSVGVLSGLMWLPFSGLIRHWIGFFHGIVRTALVVAAWYLYPHARFVVIPAVIVAVYLVTILVLARRGAVRTGPGVRTVAT